MAQFTALRLILSGLPQGFVEVSWQPLGTIIARDAKQALAAARAKWRLIPRAFIAVCAER